MTENRKAHVIVLRAAAVLLILVMLSTSMVAGRYARYTSSASGNDSARVAKFRVTESGDLKTTFIVKISPGKSVDKTTDFFYAQIQIFYLKSRILLLLF